jgi:ABC-2 type transport system ATP-binding protein
MAPVIACDGLVKVFGTTRALDGLDLRVEDGEIHGFLGPNGAGKTVTMRILLGLLRPTAGRATVFGADPWADAVALHRRLAYVPGDTNLWPNLTGGEIIDLLGDLRGGIDRARRAELIERFDLDPRMKARAYSKGNRQKVALVAALASDAALLILDEPTAGLDPLMEAVFQDVLLDVAAEGRTVLLSSHILAEVEKVCDRVTIIRAGKAVETGSLAELRMLSRVTMVAELASDGDRLAAVPGVHDLRREDGRVSFEVDHEALADVVRHLGDLGVRSLVSTPPTLEQLFLRHYGDELEQGRVDHPAIAPNAGRRGGDGP